MGGELVIVGLVFFLDMWYLGGEMGIFFLVFLGVRKVLGKVF